MRSANLRSKAHTGGKLIWCLCFQCHMFTSWFTKVFVHVFLVSDSCQPPVPMTTTRNIVLTLTLGCGRTPQNLGRTCNPSNTRSFLFRHCTGCFCDITARWQSPNTQHPTQSRSVFNLRFITHECVRAECAERGKKRHQTDTNKQLTWWLHSNCSAVFGKQPLLAEPVNGLCNRTFPPRVRVSKDAN